MMNHLFRTLLLALPIFGCTPAKEDPFTTKIYEAKVRPDELTLQMIEKVKEHHDAIQPELVNYALNGRKAKIMQARLDSLSPGKEMDLLLYDYAEELLRAGNINESIVIFEDFYNFFQEKDFPEKVETIAEVQRRLAIANLRKAEIENCVINHNNESCIIPLSEKAQYKITEHSLKAIEYIEQFLQAFPGDYEVQYLLNIAHMTLGQYPDQVPDEFRLPESYFERSEFPRFKDIAMDVGVDVRALSGGICLDDFNNDGYLDLMVSSWGVNDQIIYFENDGTGGFEDKTSHTGLVGVTGGLNLKHADYNNDGHLDFLILRGAWLEEYGDIPNSLIQNNGDGTFTDVTQKAGLFSTFPTQTAVWADFDLDGWIDLFIANESLPEDQNNCELFLNNRDGTFTEISRQAGIEALGYFKGVAAGDINNDGYPDLYLSDYYGKNLLYVNSSHVDQLSFDLASIGTGVSQPIESFPTWMFDYNNDGLEDIFVSGYSSDNITPVNMLMANMRNQFGNRRPCLYRNNGDGTFTNIAYEANLRDPETTMGCNFGDLDNDGFLDFYLATGDPSFISIVPNKMYRNVMGQRFEDVTFSGGFGHIQKGHAVGFGDLDMDGDQDVYVVMGGAYEGDFFQNVLFENPGAGNNNWIHIQLEGTSSNRSAIGARIKLTIQDGPQERAVYHTIGTGASFGGNSLLAEIGVGKAQSIDQLEITWPTKEQDSSIFRDININQTIKIMQGKQEYAKLDLSPVTFKKGPHHHH